MIHVKSCISTRSIRIATLVDFNEFYEAVKPTQAKFQEGFQIAAEHGATIDQSEEGIHATNQRQVY